MKSQLLIEIIDPDPDYCGIDVSAHNGCFSGSARIYAQLDDLKNLATAITGFPTNSEDIRTYSLGTQDDAYAGGFCSMRFYCLDGTGHIGIDLIFVDDFRFHSRANAEFSLESIEAAQIDFFVDQLRRISVAESGTASIQ